LAAEGLSKDIIAARLDTPRQIISKWRKRFPSKVSPAWRRSRAAGLQSHFPPTSSLKRMACERPMDAGVALVRWHRVMVVRRLVATISGATPGVGWMPTWSGRGA
jgi:hypothetical protein